MLPIVDLIEIRGKIRFVFLWAMQHRKVGARSHVCEQEGYRGVCFLLPVLRLWSTEFALMPMIDAADGPRCRWARWDSSGCFVLVVVDAFFFVV